MPLVPAEPASDRLALGVVVIGRNEGERLRACLHSIDARKHRVVYVDSGSTDDSRALARGLGAEVLELDLSIPFTAARARNAGWRFLRARTPDLRYVQFLDGDCALDEQWLQEALAHMERYPASVAVCGRRRERNRDATVYNRLCDVEWDTPVGVALACGGDALMRLDALGAVDGFNESLIAGEEPELCFRLRERGGLIERLPLEMTRHDAAMSSWQQWWKRSQRAGYSFANGAQLHGASPERYYRAEVRSILLWALLIPLLVLAAAWMHPLGAALALVYPFQVWRLRRRYLREGRMPAADCGSYAWNCVLGKFPNLFGVLSYHSHRLRGTQRGLIEYK